MTSSKEDGENNMATIVPVIPDALMAKAQPDLILKLDFTLTAGAGVNVAALLGVQSIAQTDILVEGGTGSALTAITQSTVDTLLGSTNEIIVTTAYGTTAMVDNDTYALVINMSNCVRAVSSGRVSVSIAGAGAVAIGAGTKTALTNAAFTGVNVYVTSLGNLGCRVNYTNISAAATAGFMFWEIPIYLK